MRSLPRRVGAGMTLGEAAEDTRISRATLRALRESEVFMPDQPGGRYSVRAVGRLVEEHPELVPERGASDLI